MAALAAVAMWAPACTRHGTRADAAPVAANDVDSLQAAATEAIQKARAAPLGDVARTISLPSIERLVEDAAVRRASITAPERDWAFVRRTLQTARAYAERLAGGDDPYRTATGVLVKAYRADWDGTLQPYALYVPRGRPQGGAAARWPLIVALHGAFSNHRHNLRRVFGVDNRPGESDEEAARNDLPLPDVPALVVSPYGRGELMGYDGLGEEDVLRVLADVRRAYDVDPDRITLTGLSMGGGGTWNIGLRHPELFAALAPVCGVTDVRKWIAPADAALYDQKRLDEMSPPAIAENAAGMQVFIFHGADDPTVPVTDSRRMVERYRTLGWLGKTVRYTEFPGVGHAAWVPAYAGAELLRTLATIKRDGPRSAPIKRQPADLAVASLFSKSLPRERPHIYVYGSNGPAAAVAAARALATALADWGPGVAARFALKSDRDVTAADRARFNLVLVGAAPLNTLTASLTVPGPAARPVGDSAFRAIVRDPQAPSRFALVFGALTPAGFAKLTRFAHPNQEVWAPESNLPFVSFP